MSKVLYKLYALLGMSQERIAERAENKQALQMQGHPHTAHSAPQHAHTHTHSHSDDEESPVSHTLFAKKEIA